MKYKLDLSPKIDVSAPPITGAQVGQQMPFFAWQPSTWPKAPANVDDKFVDTLKRIFEDSILLEINNVISDAKECNGGLEHRGHVVAIGLLCALDAISSYGYGAKSGRQIPDFIRRHFPREYHPHAHPLLYLYRHAMVHSWNLFKASISPTDDRIANQGGILSIGLLNFFDALVFATENFLEALATDSRLQRKSLARYGDLRRSAR